MKRRYAENGRYAKQTGAPESEVEVEVFLSLGDNLSWIGGEVEDYARIHLCVVALGSNLFQSFPWLCSLPAHSETAQETLKCFELST